MHISFFFSTVKGLSLAQNAWLEALQATLTWWSNRRASIPVYINTECMQIVHPVHSAQYIRSVCLSTEIHCMVVFQRSPAWLCQDTVFAHIPSLILTVLPHYPRGPQSFSHPCEAKPNAKFPGETDDRSDLLYPSTSFNPDHIHLAKSQFSGRPLQHAISPLGPGSPFITEHTRHPWRLRGRSQSSGAISDQLQLTAKARRSSAVFNR